MSSFSVPIIRSRQNHSKCKGHHGSRCSHKTGIDPDLINIDFPQPNKHLFNHIHERQYGFLPKHHPQKLADHYVCQQLPGLLKEHEYSLGKINKIFASLWLSDRQVVFGTKCNKFIVQDLVSKQQAHIPSLKSSSDSSPADCPCGIHSIAMNPSKTLIATGGENTNDLAVYKLPTFDPVCVGEFGHTDWIFDIKWLDDEFVVTGSRDNSMALWCVRDEDMPAISTDKSSEIPEHTHIRPVASRVCKRAEKVRSMAYNRNTQELVALSLNAYLHLWDANKFIQRFSSKLVHIRENVCMGVCELQNLYGIGSQSHITLIDPRSLNQINHIVSKQRGCGIRSINFKENLMTVGTGAGSIFFYDLRAGGFMEHDCGHTLGLNLGKGWMLQDDTYRDFFYNQEYPNAVYTHSMDESGTKLFAAGGPLPAGLWGNYAGVWT